MHAEKAWDAFRLYRANPGRKATQFERDDYERARRDFRASYGKGKRAADGTRIKIDEPPKITYLGIFDTVGQRGVPSALEIAVFAWLVIPILIAYYLSRTGRYEGAHILSSFSLTGLVEIPAIP